MVSFLNVHLPVLMQVNRSEGGTLLPWPNGSLLSGRLMPPAEGSGAMLMLGNYRVRVEVPPNTPMGQIWMQLLQRELPGQFRLLTDKQAAMLIADMLKKNDPKAELLKNMPQEQNTAKASGEQHAVRYSAGQQEWGKLPTDSIPFGVQAYGDRLMLLDQKDGGAQGLLQKDEGVNTFMLSGRLDLEHMGGLAFSLEGRADAPWKIHVHLANHTFKHEVEQSFLDWLEKKQQEVTHPLEGAVFETMPESLGLDHGREA